MNQWNCNEQKNSFFVSSKKYCLSNNNKIAHWVGHSKLKHLYTDDFSKEKSHWWDIKSSLTDNTIRFNPNVVTGSR